MKLKRINSVVLLSLLFPFVGFLKGSDIQPIFILFLVFSFIVSNQRINLEYLILFVFCLISYSIHAFFFVSSEFLGFYLAHAITVVLVFFLYTLRRNLFHSLSFNLLIFVTVVYVGVGIIQHFDPYFLSNIIGRSESQIELLLTSGRGVRSLTGEPSDFGRVIFILNILIVLNLIFSNKNGFDLKLAESKKREDIAIIATIILLFLSAVLTWSPYAVMIHLIFFGSLLMIYRPIMFFSLFIVFLVLLSLILDYLFIVSGVRIFDVLKVLLEQPEKLTEYGAIFRLTNIPFTVLTGIKALPFGVIASPPPAFISIFLPIIGEITTYARFRYFGGAGESWLFFGIGSLIYFLFIGVIFSRAFKVLFKRSKKGLFLFFPWIIFLIFQDGSPSNPMPWLVLVYSIAILENSKFEFKVHKKRQP